MVEFSCEAVWTWAFVCWKISDYSFNFCACDGSVKDFLFLPGSVLESCAFLRICPFLPSCPFYWHIDVIVVSYNPLYFCVVCCELSIFISNFIDVISLPLFLDESGYGLSVLFILSKNQLLVLLIFAVVSFVSFAFISALIFKIFLSFY